MAVCSTSPHRKSAAPNASARMCRVTTVPISGTREARHENQQNAASSGTWSDQAKRTMNASLGGGSTVMTLQTRP
jgi:hypothetical protein